MTITCFCWGSGVVHEHVVDYREEVRFYSVQIGSIKLMANDIHAGCFVTRACPHDGDEFLI
jgi:hypothetical protein